MNAEKKIKKRHIIAGIILALIALIVVLNQLGVFRNLLVSRAQSSSQAQQTIQAQIDTGRDQIFRENIIEYNDISCPIILMTIFWMYSILQITIVCSPQSLMFMAVDWLEA